MKGRFTFLFLLMAFVLGAQSDEVILTVRDAKSSSPISYAYISLGGTGYATSFLGEARLPASREEKKVCVSVMGYRDTCFMAILNKPLTLSLTERSVLLLEAEVLATPGNASGQALRERVLTSEVKVRDLETKALVLGELDLLKGLQFIPGVQGGNPGSSNVHVRGGDHYQNQLLLDGVPIYNLVHINGATSPLPSQGMGGIKLYREAVPLKYNGASSAYLASETRAADHLNWKGGFSLGIGAISANLNAPIVKGRSSLQFAGRFTTLGPILYLDYQVNKNDGAVKTAGGFHDGLLKYSHRLKGEHKLEVILYNSLEFLGESDDDIFGNSNPFDHRRRTSNAALGTSLKGRLSKNLLYEEQLFVSDYGYSWYDRKDARDDGSGFFIGAKDFQYDYGLRQYGWKNGLQWFMGGASTLGFGSEINIHSFQYPKWILKEPNDIPPVDTSGNGGKLLLPNVALYAGYTRPLNDWLTAQAGARLQYHGLQHNASQFFLLPRLSLEAVLSKHWASFLAYDEMTQPLHRLRQGVLLSSQDLATAPSQRLPVEHTRQLSTGIVYTLPWFEFQAQLYYRQFQNFVDKDYSQPQFFTTVQGQSDEVLADPSSGMLPVDGEAYGLELGAKLRVWRLSFDAAYSYGKSLRQSDQLNLGRSYNYDFNRTHNLQTNAHIKFKRTSIGKVVELGLSWFYGSGYYTHFPFYFTRVPDFPGRTGGFWQPVVTERNSAQLPALHHLDVAINFIKDTPKSTRTFSISVYNAYLSPVVNLYTYDGSNKLKTEGVLPFVPSITYRYQWK